MISKIIDRATSISSFAHIILKKNFEWDLFRDSKCFLQCVVEYFESDQRQISKHWRFFSRHKNMKTMHFYDETILIFKIATINVFSLSNIIDFCFSISTKHCNRSIKYVRKTIDEQLKYDFFHQSLFRATIKTMRQM